MKSIIAISRCIFLVGIVIFSSCKKETSCENCADKSKPPIAMAGPDQLITLPIDSSSLDGSSSSDPDGTISAWLWTKLSGPVSFNIIRPSDSSTKIKNLVVGAYQFELKVTDNGGLSAKDTLQVIVKDLSQPNRPPVANAGADQTIVLPANAVTLDGNASTDPDNNITNYLWAKISGPSSFNLGNANVVQAQVTNFVQGVYQFELKVTDAGGLFSKDTVQVTVNPASPPPPINICDPGIRPFINAQLLPIGNLSQARYVSAVANAGNKIVFAGGGIYTGTPGNAWLLATSRVDILDVVTNTWSIAELSEPRWSIAAGVIGNKIFFAGGNTTVGAAGFIYPSSRVDIYDVSSNTWSTAELSHPTGNVSAAVLGNRLFVAGGNWVDIYDAASDSWSVVNLSEYRLTPAATTIGNKIYFAGGTDSDFDWTPSSKIDIYDGATNSWSTSVLSEPRAYMASIPIGNKIFWAGGYTANTGYTSTNTVEIRDIVTQNTSFECLFRPNEFGYYNTGVKNDKVAFISFDENVLNKFDIYDITNNTWSVGLLNQNAAEGGIVISVNNIIYLAGGKIMNGVASNQVWKLEF